MKKLLIYGKEVYEDGDGITIKPAGVRPDEEYDVSHLEKDKIKEIRKDIKKIKKYGKKVHNNRS